MIYRRWLRHGFHRQGRGDAEGEIGYARCLTAEGAESRRGELAAASVVPRGARSRGGRDGVREVSYRGGRRVAEGEIGYAKCLTAEGAESRREKLATPRVLPRRARRRGGRNWIRQVSYRGGRRVAEVS